MTMDSALKLVELHAVNSENITGGFSLPEQARRAYAAAKAKSKHKYRVESVRSPRPKEAPVRDLPSAPSSYVYVAPRTEPAAFGAAGRTRKEPFSFDYRRTGSTGKAVSEFLTQLHGVAAPGLHQAPAPFALPAYLSGAPLSAAPAAAKPEPCGLQSLRLHYAAPADAQNDTHSLGSPESARFFLADGVSLNLAESTRFYDTGKGYYWNAWSNSAPYRGAQELYTKTGNWSFLGELAPWVKQGGGFNAHAFDNLNQDSDTCWYQSSADILQYWQSYYGVFSNNAASMPYGYTYAPENLALLQGTQSLKTGMYFYTHWANTGGDFTTAADWYLSGSDYVNGGGFFAAHFAGASATESYAATSLKGLTTVVMQALGVSAGGDTLSHPVPGLIAQVGIETAEGAGHALTLYGFTLGGDGKVDSLYLTNSDDCSYELMQLYVGEDNGSVRFYNDAAHTDEWEFSREHWLLSDVAYIATPDVLQDRYADYCSNALSWNGERSTWSASGETPASTLALPAASTGWDVEINGAHYHSYYAENRAVQFGDLGGGGTVAVSGDIRVGELRLSGYGKDYLFCGEAGASVTADTLAVSGGAGYAWEHVALTAESLNLTEGRLLLGSGTVYTGQSADVSRGGVLQLDGSNVTISGNLTVGEGSVLAVTSASSLSAGNWVLEAGAGLSFTLAAAGGDAPLLSFSGNLTLNGPVSINVEGTGLTQGSVYKLISFAPGSSYGEDVVAAFRDYEGSLTLVDNVLNYTYAPTPVWNRGSGVWTSGVLPDGHAVEIADSGAPQRITVSGTVAPGKISVTSGDITFEGAGTIAGRGAVDISGAGTSLTAKLSLGERPVEVRSGASFTYRNHEDTAVSKLLIETDSRVSFDNDGAAGTTYTIHSLGTVNGDISVTAGTNLTFALNHDASLNGTVETSADSELRFSNSSETKDISYSLAQGTHAIAGAIVVGGEHDSHGTTLSIPNGTSAGYSINAHGTLELTGDGTFDGTAHGNGTLKIARGAEYTMAVQTETITDLTIGSTPVTHVETRLPFDTSLALAVEGALVIGDAAHALTKELSHDITVSGHLTAYVMSSYDYQLEWNTYWPVTNTFALPSVTLDGGALSTNVVVGDSRYAVVDSLQNIEHLHVTEQGGRLSTSYDGFYINMATRVSIDTLSGIGDLSLHGASYIRSNVYSISATDAYSGNITVKNDERTWTDGHLYASLTTLELADATVGDVSLYTASVTNRDGFVALGVSGNATTGALNSDAGSQAILYSGRWADADFTMSDGFDAHVAKLYRTLTINNTTDGDFNGVVKDCLSLVKQGTGTQTFSGDLSAFNRSVEVQDGTLALRGGSTFSAKSIRISGGMLDIADGTWQIGAHGAEPASVSNGIVIDTATGAVAGSGSVQHATLRVDSADTMEASSVTVSDSDIINAGSGTLNLAASTALDRVQAVGGDINLLHLGNAASLKLNDMILADNRTIGAYSGSEMNEGSEARLLLEGTLSFGMGTTLNADLTLGRADASVAYTVVADGTLDMGCSLTLNRGGALAVNSEAYTMAQQALAIGGDALDSFRYVLFSGVDELTLGHVTVSNASGSVVAANYFTNMGNGWLLTYAVADNGWELALTAPEPATATLSLLALGALAFRRRRD